MPNNERHVGYIEYVYQVIPIYCFSSMSLIPELVVKRSHLLLAGAAASRKRPTIPFSANFCNFFDSDNMTRDRTIGAEN